MTSTNMIIKRLVRPFLIRITDGNLLQKATSDAKLLQPAIMLFIVDRALCFQQPLVMVVILPLDLVAGMGIMVMRLLGNHAPMVTTSKATGFIRYVYDADDGILEEQT